MSIGARHHGRSSIPLLLSLTLAATVARAAKTFTPVLGNDWNTPANWGGALPVASDDVIINGNVMLTNSPPALASYTLNASKFHTFNGWNTVLTAAVVNISGTMTHTNNLATNAVGGVWIPNARVRVVCTDLTVTSTGKIDVNGKGYGGAKLNYKDGHGPGRGFGVHPAAGGGGYGGVGGRATSIYGQTYGSASVPEQPGSGGGGGMTDSIPGGNGGGAVWIEASDEVSVVGSISANGVGRNRHYSGGGSGGAVHIVCRTISGNGTISASGEATGVSGGAGGGGRIAIIYGPTAQNNAPLPGVTFSASAAGDYVPSDLGTLYFPDSQFLLRQTGVVRHSGVWLPPLSSWERDMLTLSSAWLRFPTEGFTLTVTNAMTVQGTEFYPRRLELSNGVVRVGGRLMLNKAGLMMFRGTTTGPSLTCGELMVSNSALMHVYSGITQSPRDPGALVEVAGPMVVAATSWVYPYAHPISGGSVLFRVGSLRMPTAGAGIDATGRGYMGGTYMADGFGPGRGKGGTYGGGGGYGGFGGYVTVSTHGQTNGMAHAPLQPGSGGGGGTGTDFPGGNGGGAIRVESAGDVVLNGSLLSKGLGRVGHNSGSGSGGAIFITCKSFRGTGGTINAEGENGPNSNLGGGGGGGRIAVWQDVPGDRREALLAGDLSGAVIATNSPAFTGTLTAGIGTYSRTPKPTVGTVVFLTMPPPQGTLMLVR